MTSDVVVFWLLDGEVISIIYPVRMSYVLPDMLANQITATYIRSMMENQRIHTRNGLLNKSETNIDASSIYYA